jgi:hypothetical protein
MSALAPFVCLGCRASFRRPFHKGVDYRPCASCGKPAVRVDVRFRTPRKTDDKQWKKVEFLFQQGFYFQKVYRQIARGTYLRVPYPSDLADARRFVIEFKSQAITPNTSLEPTPVTPVRPLRGSRSKRRGSVLGR